MKITRKFSVLASLVLSISFGHGKSSGLRRANTREQGRHLVETDAEEESESSFSVTADVHADTVVSNGCFGPQPVVSSFTGGETFPSFAGTDTIGFCFTSSIDQLITQLGVLDASEYDGSLTSDHEVRLWRTSDMKKLASATITTSSVLINGFRYETLKKPVTIQADTNYTLGAVYTLDDGDEYVSNPSSISLLNIDATNAAVADFETSGLSFPGRVSQTNLARLGPNAIVAQIDTDGDGVGDACDLCPGTVIPESVPTEELLVNHFALTSNDSVESLTTPLPDLKEFQTTSPSEEATGPQRSYTIADTHGCSCKQIIAKCGLGNGQEKFGCSIGVMDAAVKGLCEDGTPL